MSWLYGSVSGDISEVWPPLDKIMLSSGSGWHGPFKSYQEAVDYYNANKANNPGWKAPTSSFAGQVGNAVDSRGQQVTKALDPLAKYDLNSWLLRIGEILLGLVLLGVGIAKLTGTTNMVAKAVKAAI